MTSSNSPDKRRLTATDLMHKLGLETLVGAQLDRANLSGVDLSYADLREANLSQAELINSDLSHANLSHANLSYADLWAVNFKGAKLVDVNLLGADLRSTNLADADLTGVKYDNSTIWPSGFSPAPRTLNAESIIANIATATEEPVKNLHDAIDALDIDEAARDALRRQLSEFEQSADDAARVELNRAEQKLLLEVERQRGQIEDEQRRRRIQMFLDKELWAVAIGGLLLILLAFFLAFATVGLIATDNDELASSTLRIIENAFLILLGFFFSQGVAATQNAISRRGRQSGQRPTAEPPGD